MYYNPQIEPITKLSREPRVLLEKAKKAPVHLTAHGVEEAVLISAEGWRIITEQLEELENLRDILAAYKAEIDLWEGRGEVEKVDLDQLEAELQYAPA